MACCKKGTLQSFSDLLVKKEERREEERKGKMGL